MEERIRIAAIIIRDNKLLLVKGSEKYNEYWTPGGKLESGETDKECLVRELKEEINATIKSARFFKEYISKSPYNENTLTINRVYFVEISGNLKPAKEIKRILWLSRNDFEGKIYPLIDITQEAIIPDLIRLGYFLLL